MGACHCQHCDCIAAAAVGSAFTTAAAGAIVTTVAAESASGAAAESAAGEDGDEDIGPGLPWSFDAETLALAIDGSHRS